MIDVFTPKRISADCLFKSNHRQVKNLILFPRCAIYLHGVLHTAEIVCGEHRDHLRSVMHTVDMISALCCTSQRSFVIEFLGEIETDSENTLGCLSGAQMGLNQEKNRGQKSRDTLPLNKKHSITHIYFFTVPEPYGFILFFSTVLNIIDLPPLKPYCEEAPTEHYTLMLVVKNN